MPFEPLDETARLRGGEGFIEGRWLVRAEIVLHQHDLARTGKVSVGQRLEDLRVIERGVAVGHRNMAPSLQWGEQHEQVGGAIALILVVVARWPSRLCRDWDAGFLDELLRRLVQADDGAVRIVRPLIDPPGHPPCWLRRRRWPPAG